WAPQPAKQSGTWFADTIRASGQTPTASTGRTEDCTRPTSQHQITLATREPSTEDTLTAGVVLQPDWIPGLRLSVDYHDISIDGQIGSLNADDILRQCFE